MKQGKSRDLSLDVLRIIACVMVVLVHTAMEGWYNISPRTYTWTVLNFYDTIGRPSIAVFVMIGGSIFLRRERIDLKRLWLKNILRFFVVYIFWLFFYAVMNNGIHKVLAEPNLVWEDMISSNPQYHLWYLRMIMNVYAIAPLLWFLVRALDRKTVKYFLILFFVFGILHKTVTDLYFVPKWIRDQIGIFVDMDLVRYSGFFILGYYLSDGAALQRCSSKVLRIFYIAALLLAAGLNQLIAAIDNWPTQALYGNFNIFVAAEAVCLFVLIRRRYENRQVSPVRTLWLERISDSTLFVYLIHPFVIRRLQIHLHLYTTNWNVLFSVPAVLLLVVTLSSVCGMLLKRIPAVKYLV